MIALNREGVAGSYESIRNDVKMVLRIDVGTPASLDVISGDLFFETSPGNYEFHHSFRTTDIVGPESDGGNEVLRSTVKVFREDMLDLARLDLTVPPQGEMLATYTFYRLTSFGRQEALSLTFPLTRASTFFRRIELEVDRVEGIPMPEAFETDTHPETPSTFPPRALTFEAAFQEAGIDLVTTIDPNTIPTDDPHGAGGDDRWTDEELHAAMVHHFSRYEEAANWQLYLLLATRYVDEGVLGIMFDSNDDFPRQGSAVFYNHRAISGAAESERDREYLYTIVHELGHALNLLHSFQKGIFETHGIIPRPAALSWMNYPQLYPYGYAYPPDHDGSNSFWKQFTFLFENDELAHIRHGDSLEVMMGGRSFGFAGHLEERPFEIPHPGLDGLTLSLWLPPVIEFMQQVEGDLRLRNESKQPVKVHGSLHLGSEHVDLLVRRGNDRVPKVFRHHSQLCFKTPFADLKPGESYYQEITPSYGARHWFVDEPGTYQFQAVYRMPDGRRLASEIRTVRVTLPAPEADRQAADFFSRDTGVYLAVEGSRALQLSKTRDVLEGVTDRLKGAAITKQVQVVNAMCENRVFKDAATRKVIVPDRARTAAQLAKTVGVNLAKRVVRVDESLSNIRVNRVLREAASAFASADEKKKAEAVIGSLDKMLKQVKAPTDSVKKLETFARSLKS